MFKILNGITQVPTESIVAFNTSQTRRHNSKLHQLPESTNIYIQSFSLTLSNYGTVLSPLCNDLKQFKSLVFQFVIS